LCLFAGSRFRRPWHAAIHHLFAATIGQASRPARGIRVPEVLLMDNVPLEFWRGHEAAIAESHDGSIIRYEPDPSNTGYLGSPAWSQRPRIEDAAYRDIKALLTTISGRRSRPRDPEAA